MKSVEEAPSEAGEIEPSASGSPTPHQPAVSVVVPVVERPEDLAGLYREYSLPLRQRGWNFEFLFILEPWALRLRESLAPLAAAGEPVRVLEVGRVIGEAGQLKLAGFECRADIVVTLPAYHRVHAECLPELISRASESAQLAVARRFPRRDAWLNRIQNRVFHALVGVASNQPFKDIACGVRAMRRELLREIPLYGDSSRFLPLLASQEGFSVEEVSCMQHPLDRKARVYSIGTYVRRIVDLFGMFFLLRFTYRPLRFFGVLGGSLSSIGGVILVIVLVQRLMGQGLANRPILLLGVLLFTLGFQVAALGLLGELIVHFQAPARPSYRVRDTD